MNKEYKYVKLTHTQEIARDLNIINDWVYTIDFEKVDFDIGSKILRINEFYIESSLVEKIECWDCRVYHGYIKISVLFTGGEYHIKLRKKNG